MGTLVPTWVIPVGVLVIIAVAIFILWKRRASKNSRASGKNQGIDIGSQEAALMSENLPNAFPRIPDWKGDGDGHD